MEYFLNCEFNLLIYGVGSKREVINKFAVRTDLPRIIVNGYHVGTSIKSLLNSI